MLSKSKVKDIQSLSQKKSRDQAGVFVAEGPKIVFELLSEANIQVKEVFATAEWISAAEPGIGDIKEKIVEVSAQDLKKISSLQTPNQVLAIFRQPEPQVDKNSRLTLMLDTIQDPGNLGTMIRCADWFGVSQIICSPDTVDCYNFKVVQASMSSIARVSVQYHDLSDYLDRHPDKIVYGAMLEGEHPEHIVPTAQAILLIGNESRGISEALVNRVNFRISIPGKGGAESLNAAVATAILLYSFTRL